MTINLLIAEITIKFKFENIPVLGFAIILFLMFTLLFATIIHDSQPQLVAISEFNYTATENDKTSINIYLEIDEQIITINKNNFVIKKGYTYKVVKTFLNKYFIIKIMSKSNE